eukprot:tig00021037_g17461.t1
MRTLSSRLADAPATVCERSSLALFTLIEEMALVGGGRVRLVSIGERTYRVPLDEGEDAILQHDEDFDDEEEEDGFEDDAFVDADDADAAIQRDGDGFKLRIPLARDLCTSVGPADACQPLTPPRSFRFLIGRQGATKNKIQSETGATIAIPRQDDPAEEIVIRGPTQAAVSSARTRVEIIMEEALRSLPYTHFVSIRLGSQGSQHWQRVAAFREQVLARYGTARGVDPSIFVPPEQMHLTLVMLRLYGAGARRDAEAALQRCAKAVERELGKKPLSVGLSGLDYMCDDRGEVDVLYAKVGTGLDRLSRLCDAVMAEFRTAGLVDEQQSSRALKLHATLMNSKYRKNDAPAERAPRVSFDASGILRDFASFDFGEVKLTGVELSRRGGKDPATLYYPREAVLPLP